MTQSYGQNIRSRVLLTVVPLLVLLGLGCSDSVVTSIFLIGHHGFRREDAKYGIVLAMFACDSFAGLIL
jgi:hypothetical protein